MLPNAQKIADLVPFTEEILNGKLHFLCSDKYNKLYKPSQTRAKLISSRVFENLEAAVSRYMTKYLFLKTLLF